MPLSTELMIASMEESFIELDSVAVWRINKVALKIRKLSVIPYGSEFVRSVD